MVILHLEQAVLERALLSSMGQMLFTATNLAVCLHALVLMCLCELVCGNSTANAVSEDE